VLVEATGAEGVPRVELGCDPKVAEPISLESFMEVARSFGRNPPTSFGYLFKFSLAFGVTFIKCEFFG